MLGRGKLFRRPGDSSDEDDVDNQPETVYAKPISQVIHHVTCIRNEICVIDQNTGYIYTMTINTSQLKRKAGVVWSPQVRKIGVEFRKHSIMHMKSICMPFESVARKLDQRMEGGFQGRNFVRGSQTSQKEFYGNQLVNDAGKSENGIMSLEPLMYALRTPKNLIQNHRKCWCQLLIYILTKRSDLLLKSIPQRPAVPEKCRDGQIWSLHASPLNIHLFIAAEREPGPATSSSNSRMLTNDEKNKLSAKLLKAEMLGNKVSFLVKGRHYWCAKTVIIFLISCWYEYRNSLITGLYV